MYYDCLLIISSVCGIAFFASFVHGAVGLGYGMIAMGVMSFFVPYSNCAAIVSLQLTLLTLQIAFTLRKNIDWRLVLVPMTVMSGGKILGVIVLMNLTGNIMKILLGLMLIIFSLNGLFVKNEKLIIKGNTADSVIFPFVGGLFGGMFNVSGPAAALYFQAACKGDTKKYSACLNFTFVPSAVVGTIMHVIYGNYSRIAITAGGLSLVAVIVGVYLGIKVFVKINYERLKKITFAYIGLMGIMICVF